MLAETVLAVLLLQMPQLPEAWLQSEQVRGHWPWLRVCLTAVALDWEILDPREVPYVLTQPESLPVDLHMLRQRQRELADAPCVNDALIFPRGDTVQQAINFNRACVRWFDEHYAHCRDLPPAKIAYRRQLDELYRVWDTLREVQCDYYMVSVRRQCLKQLRALLGEDSYREGRLPPPVPFDLMPWR
uniref:Hypothetical conserved protein n=1 Tax=uncultured Planctomycetota bacterium TaxID=120965 RepID=H5SFR4_9BACT|nr:hypothetical conserved protein [uncultured Planctomycetota bacterium]